MLRRFASTLPFVIGAAAMCVAPSARRVFAVEASCIGDCNDSGMVEIVELVMGLRIALGADPVSRCPAWDPDANGTVTINELTHGINAALSGCPPINSEPNRCGDGKIAGQEQCDDGNTIDGDGCSATCAIEGPGAIDQIWNGCDGAGGSININEASPVGQQFTPSATTLSGVAVRIERQMDAPGTPSLTLRIRAGSIDGAVLGEQSRTITNDGPYLFVFDPALSVVPGTVHVIELLTADPYPNWVRAGDTSCTYPGGAPIFFGAPTDGEEDLIFATYTP